MVSNNRYSGMGGGGALGGIEGVLGGGANPSSYNGNQAPTASRGAGVRH